MQTQNIHIWYLPTTPTPSPSCLESLSRVLNQQELAKAKAFIRFQDQQAYLIQRGCLRYVLSRYLKEQPAWLEFAYGPHGKPYLKTDPLQFNLSHSKSRLAIAISQTWSVGIDIEHLRPIQRLESLCQRCLTPTEIATFPDWQYPRANHRFFQYWTCKEAYLKGLGLGLTRSMSEVEIPLATIGRSAQPIPALSAAVSLAQTGWQVYPWQPEDDYIGALAVHHDPSEEQAMAITLYSTTPDNLITSHPIQIGNS